MSQHHETRVITGYLIAVKNELHGQSTIDHDLQAFYKLIGCDLIDMTECQISVRGGKRYTIICDDEALLREQPKISAIDDLGRPMFCGNIFIVRTDAEGNTLSLDAVDIAYIARFVQLQGTYKFPRPYPMLHQCEYA